MCGIFAIINKSESSNHNDTLKKLSKGLLKIKSNPDSTGKYYEKRIKSLFWSYKIINN